MVEVTALEPGAGYQEGVVVVVPKEQIPEANYDVTFVIVGNDLDNRGNFITVGFTDAVEGFLYNEQGMAPDLGAEFILSNVKAVLPTPPEVISTYPINSSEIGVATALRLVFNEVVQVASSGVVAEIIPIVSILESVVELTVDETIVAHKTVILMPPTPLGTGDTKRVEVRAGSILDVDGTGVASYTWSFTVKPRLAFKEVGTMNYPAFRPLSSLAYDHDTASVVVMGTADAGGKPITRIMQTAPMATEASCGVGPRGYGECLTCDSQRNVDFSIFRSPTLAGQRCPDGDGGLIGGEVGTQLYSRLELCDCPRCAFAPPTELWPDNMSPEMEDLDVLLDQMEAREDAKVLLLCAEGYRAEPMYFRCIIDPMMNRNAIWDEMPRCVPKDCPGLPPFTDARWHNVHLDPPRTSLRLTLDFEPADPAVLYTLPVSTPHGGNFEISGALCNEGYVIMDELYTTSSTTCMFGEFVNFTTCQRQPCPTLPRGLVEGQNGVKNVSQCLGLVLGGVCTIECELGFQKTMASDGYFACMPGGVMSGQVLCEASVCEGSSLPPDLVDSEVAIKACNNVQVGEACNVTCAEGFHSALGIVHNTLTCQIDRAFAGGTKCQKISCPPPGEEERFAVIPNFRTWSNPCLSDQGALFNETCTVQCDVGFEPVEGNSTIRCDIERLASGGGRDIGYKWIPSWVGPQVACAQAGCGEPPAIVNGTSDCERLQHGEECGNPDSNATDALNITCDEGFVPVGFYLCILGTYVDVPSCISADEELSVVPAFVASLTMQLDSDESAVALASRFEGLPSPLAIVFASQALGDPGKADDDVVVSMPSQKLATGRRLQDAAQLYSYSIHVLLRHGRSASPVNRTLGLMMANSTLVRSLLDAQLQLDCARYSFCRQGKVPEVGFAFNVDTELRQVTVRRTLSLAEIAAEQDKEDQRSTVRIALTIVAVFCALFSILAVLYFFSGIMKRLRRCCLGHKDDLAMVEDHISVAAGVQDEQNGRKCCRRRAVEPPQPQKRAAGADEEEGDIDEAKAKQNAKQRKGVLFAITALIFGHHD